MFKKFALIAAIGLALGACASAPEPASVPAPAAPAAAQPAKPNDAQNRAAALVKGEMGDAAKPAVPGDTPAPAPGAAPAAPTITTAEPAAPAALEELTPKEKQFFENYLKRLKYLVVIKENPNITEFQAKSIITKANEYLLKQGYDVVNFDQLAKVTADQQTAYQAEAGAGMSLTQFIAQKLGADVYVELDVVPRAWTDGTKHYGEANYTVGMFDPSTAEQLGSVAYRSDRSLSNSNPEDALINALVASVAQFMPRVVKDANQVLRNRYSNGIRYQLILQSTPDARAVSTFRRSLRSRVREIVAGPSAADQTTMDVYLFGSITDLEDACYSAFEKTAGMESAYWVYTRGKTITFNTGN